MTGIISVCVCYGSVRVRVGCECVCMYMYVCTYVMDAQHACVRIRDIIITTTYTEYKSVPYQV